MDDNKNIKFIDMKIKIELPKGYMNAAVTSNNFFISDTNNSSEWDTLKFPLPRGKWSIFNISNKNVILQRRCINLLFLFGVIASYLNIRKRNTMDNKIGVRNELVQLLIDRSECKTGDNYERMIDDYAERIVKLFTIPVDRANYCKNKTKRFKVKCIEATVSLTRKEHFLTLEQTPENTGMFGSKIAKQQFEKIESVLSKRYIKLPFGIRIIF